MTGYALFTVAVVVVLGRLWYDRWKGIRAHKTFVTGWEAARAGDWEKAEAALRTAVRLQPIFAVARRCLGFVLANRGQIREAEEQLRMAASLEPRNSDGHLELELFLATHAPDRAEEALDALERAVHLAPRLSEGMKNFDLPPNIRLHPRFRQLSDVPRALPRSGRSD